jgi:hypothetical protein
VLDATDIYAAMEAGFTKNQPGAACLAAGNNLPDFELPGGIDTNLAEAIMHKACEERGGVFSQALLDYCGGHADPFHYHERMNCLYTADSVTGHSTRIGTAADGNGIYGHNINGGCEPTDLDWCGGRTGVTPDSEGQSVYYYVVSNRAPFTLGCFGPINTEAECRSLYPECDGVAQSVTTAHGTDDYDLDCPCFNPITGGNMPGQGKPKFLGPNGFDSYQLDLMNGERACNDDDGTSRPCTQDEKDAVSALYSSQKCSDGPTAPGTGGDTSPTAPGTGTGTFCGKGTQWDDENQYCVATYDGILNACRTARKEWAFTCDMMVNCDAGDNTATGKDESYLSICNTCADQKIVQQFVTSDCYECGRRCIACLNVPDHLEADAKDADGNPCSTCSSCDKYRPCAPDDSGTTATNGPLQYCDTFGCCTSDPTGSYCKKENPAAAECPPPKGTACKNTNGNDDGPPACQGATQAAKDDFCNTIKSGATCGTNNFCELSNNNGMHDNENDDSSTNDFMNNNNTHGSMHDGESPGSFMKNNNTQDAMHDGDESLDAVMKNNTN